MNSKQIQKVARRQFQTAWLWLENSFVYDWESDVFLVMRTSKYAIEIEVKISRSDFFADMKKPKHNLFKNKSGRVSRLKKHGHKYVAGQDNNNDKPQFFKSEADAQKYADQWLCEGYVITLVSI